MRSKLQLRSLGAWLLCAAIFLGCRRERAVEFTLVEERSRVRLTIGDCPPVVTETAAPLSGRARFDPPSGLTVAAPSLELRGLEPSLPPHPPPGFAFVATVVRQAPRDCHDAGYEVPAAFFRARPISIAQLQAGRFELASTGTARIRGREEGQLTWEWTARFESATPTDVAPPRLETWDRCLAEAGSGEPLDKLVGFASPLGAISIDDAGCDWVTSSSDGGTRTLSRHQMFGTLLRFDAGATSTEPDARVVSSRAVSLPGSVDWEDRDGDGRHEMERRATFGPEGDERSVEQIIWNSTGLPLERDLSTVGSAREWHIVSQRFVDGGWTTIREYESPSRCAYEPIVPIRVREK